LAERARRRRLEESRAGIVRCEKPVLFAVAAERWLAGKTACAPSKKTGTSAGR
jgi:hypothetical protein